MEAPFAIACAGATLCLFAAAHAWRASRAGRWPDQRWFAAAALTAGLHVALHTHSFFALAPQVRLLAVRAQVVLVAASVACWMVFAERLLHAPRTRLDRALHAALATGAACMLLLPRAVLHISANATEQLGPLGAACYRFKAHGVAAALVAVLALAICRCIQRLLARGTPREARQYGWSLVILLAFGIYNALVTVDVISGPLLLGVGFAVPIAVAAMVQTDRLVHTTRQLDALNLRLEREVHERSRALFEARQALDRNERLAAVGQLAAGVAHEVNNPAAAIDANLHFLREALDSGPEVEPEELRACLDESIDSVQRIARIVRQLRDSARAAAEPCEGEPVQVRRAVRAALEAAGPRLHGCAIEVEVPEALHAAANEAYLVQVLTNLVVNAAEARRAEVPQQVSIRARADDGLVRLEVADRGTGLSPEAQRRLFEPFFTTKPVTQGTGLGLAVSRGLVQRMGGTLEVASAMGQGTTVQLCLLAATPQDEAEPVAHRAPAAPGRRRRVLLVDDDPHVRRALSRQLGGRFEVVTADGVTDGLARLSSGPTPDLVLCDLVMADGGGAQLYRLLAAVHPELAKKVVFLTGGAMVAEDQRFLATQPQPVLAKPVALREIAEVAERVASGPRALAPAG